MERWIGESSPLDTHGVLRCSAAFFCAAPECMQYYCAVCWPIIHSSSARRCNHAPMVKQGDNGQRVMDMFRRRVMKMQQVSPQNSPGVTVSRL